MAKKKEEKIVICTRCGVKMRSDWNGMCAVCGAEN